MTAPRTIAITGASGLIGRHLCDHFRRAGWRVRAMMRDPSAYPFAERGIDRFLLRLPDQLDAEACRGADVVVHAAWSTRGERGGEAEARRINEEGTQRVLDACRTASVRRFIFVSSLSAHAGAVSYYGRSKLLVEQTLDPARDLIIRPGLVLAEDGGMGQRLWHFVARARVAPVFGSGRQIVQTVHIDDLCDVFSLAVERNLVGSLNVAEPEGVTMRELLRTMARAADARCLLLPVPARAVVALLRASESLGRSLPLSADSALGLTTMRHVDTRPDLVRLAIKLRTARESIAALTPLQRFNSPTP